MKEMNEQEFCGCHGEGMFDFSAWPKETKKEFKMALLRRREKILEAKLEFVREINLLMKKSPSESKE